MTSLVCLFQHAALLTAPGGENVPAARRAADREEEREAAVAEPAAAEETAVRLSQQLNRAASLGVKTWTRVRSAHWRLPHTAPSYHTLRHVATTECSAGEALPDSSQITGMFCAIRRMGLPAVG